VRSAVARWHVPELAGRRRAARRTRAPAATWRSAHDSPTSRTASGLP